MTKIEDTLLSTRSDYQKGLERDAFLLNAYAGTGGFEGRARMPLSSFWGWAADVYDDLPTTAIHDTDETGIETYLDRHDREDSLKFMRRVSRSHYPNYIAPAIDIPLSFMHRKPLLRKPDESKLGPLGKWMENADGAGNTWDDLKRDTVLPRAAVLGWCPVLADIVDLSVTTPGTAIDLGDRTRTRALDRQAGRRVVARPMFPANLLDWEHDQTGVLKWCKTRVDYVKRDDPLSAPTSMVRITLWERDRWRWWDLSKGPRGGRLRVVAEDEGANPFGEVPIVVMRKKPVPDDPFRGLPGAGDASNEARRLFNAISELDEHLASCAFSFLQVPAEDPSSVGSAVVGNGNALAVGKDWKNGYAWITPDTNISVIYEKRIEKMIEEIFRMQKMEFVRGSKGGAARSGVSQAFEFEAANRSIADFARQDARFDQRFLRMVSPVIGGPKVEEIQTRAEKNYNVEELATQLDQTLSAITLNLGPTAESELKKMTVSTLLPHLDKDKREMVDKEIDDMAEARLEDIDDDIGNPLPRDALEAIQALRGNRDGPEDIVELDEQRSGQ